MTTTELITARAIPTVFIQLTDRCPFGLIRDGDGNIVVGAPASGGAGGVVVAFIPQARHAGYDRAFTIFAANGEVERELGMKLAQGNLDEGLVAVEVDGQEVTIGFAATTRDDLGEDASLVPQDVDIYKRGRAFASTVLWHTNAGQAAPVARDGFDEIGYACYKANNRAMNRTREVIREETSHAEADIWVHDFHLLYVPKYARETDGRPDDRYVAIWHSAAPELEFVKQVFDPDFFNAMPQSFRDEWIDAITAPETVALSSRTWRNDLQDVVNRYGAEESAPLLVAHPMSFNADAFVARCQSGAVQKEAAEIAARLGPDKIKMLIGARGEWYKNLDKIVESFEVAYERHDRWLHGKDLVLLVGTSATRSEVGNYEAHHRENIAKVDAANERLAPEAFAPLRRVLDVLDDLEQRNKLDTRLARELTLELNELREEAELPIRLFNGSDKTKTPAYMMNADGSIWYSVNEGMLHMILEQYHASDVAGKDDHFFIASDRMGISDAFMANNDGDLSRAVRPVHPRVVIPMRDADHDRVFVEDMQLSYAIADEVDLHLGDRSEQTERFARVGDTAGRLDPAEHFRRMVQSSLDGARSKVKQLQALEEWDKELSPTDKGWLTYHAELHRQGIDAGPGIGAGVESLDADGRFHLREDLSPRDSGRSDVPSGGAGRSL